LILHVFDAGESLTAEDERFLKEFAGKKRILVRNKVDLPVKLELESTVADISCATGQGLEALKDAIKELVWSGQMNSEMLEVMINSRHQDALSRARQAVERTIGAIRAEQSLEFVALDLHVAVNAVGEIVGKTTTEDLLDSIFSQFCIGK